ncbi:hypothetical protein BU23DRAFT_461894, partial [Bimuria novae-zelandiae CBS 107.79]
TLNNLGLEWLKRVFDLLTRDKATGRQRLLIANRYRSYIRVDFIAYYIRN